MVLGKFLPPHFGHIHLIDVARNSVDELTVVVGTLASEPIPGAKRFAWMKSLCPGTNVVHLTDENPQQPSEHPNFWNIWRASLEGCLPGRPDVVFASDDYGERLAIELGAQFVQVDPQRQTFAVSGTAIREAPLAHWQFLPPPVRAHYAVRVSVFGPESTGKTTLGSKLAAHFKTVMVPEYARTLIESTDRELRVDDMVTIANGQLATEDELATRCNKVLICDTDPLATTIWSQRLFGDCPEAVSAAAANRVYELTLLTDVDVPWVADPVRFLPGDRVPFFRDCERALRANSRPHLIIRGSWDQRFEQARDAIQRLFMTAA